MDQNLYTRLGERLNQNPVSLPLVEPVMEFLRQIFTEEDAELGANFPMGAHTIASLEKHYGVEASSLQSQLEEMADKGLVFTEGPFDADRKYSLTPFVPGLVEFQLMRGGESPEDIRKANLLKEMVEGIEEAAKGLFENPEVANQVINPGLRTLTVERELPLETGAQPYERLVRVLENETSFASAVCHCRHQAKLTGDPCKVEGAPSHACLYFGKAADFMVNRGFAQRISQETCFETLHASEEAGLIHNVNNFMGDNIVLCNCCGCCCDFMVKMRRYRGLLMVDPSNFMAVVDSDSCVGCGDCLDRCQLEAITLEDDMATVQQDYCIGCGNCVSVCSSEALSMVRRSEKIPIEKPDFIVGLGM